MINNKEKTLSIDKGNLKYIECKFERLFVPNNNTIYKLVLIDFFNQKVSCSFVDFDKLKATLKGYAIFQNLKCIIYPNKVAIVDSNNIALCVWYYVTKQYYIENIFKELKIVDLEEKSVNILY